MIADFVFRKNDVFSVLQEVMFILKFLFEGGTGEWKRGLGNLRTLIFFVRY